MSMFLNI